MFYQPNIPIYQGWICPKCGRTLSPTMITCPFCVQTPVCYESSSKPEKMLIEDSK